MDETYFTNLTVIFNAYTGIIKLDMTGADKFYKIYSPKKIKLKPRDDIYLDLKFKIETPNTLEPWISLLPSIKGIGLSIENDDWANNKIKKDTIQLHLLNKSFNYSINIAKEQCIDFIFLSGERCTDVIVTKYNSK